MPAYDFEDVFRDNKDSGLEPEKDLAQQRVLDVKPTNTVTRAELFEQQDSSKSSSPSTSNYAKVNHKFFEKARNFIEKTPEFKHHQYDTKDENEQRTLRSNLVKDFLSYLAPDLKNSISFKFSPENFKGVLIVPAVVLAFLGAFLPVAMLSFIVLMCGLLLYMQLNNVQVQWFEKAIWSSISQIPEEQLKQVLHSLLSNNYLQDEYTEDEIKEIIFNFMYSENKIEKMSAYLRIREAMRDLFKVVPLKEYL